MKPYAVSDGATYTWEQIEKKLVARRQFSFRYERLSKEGLNLGEFPGVVSCSIDHAALGDIKRTAQFEIQDSNDVDWLNDRIRPWVRLQMNPGSFVEWPMGLFLLSSPTTGRAGTGADLVVRSVEALDQTVILMSGLTPDRTSFTAGTTVTVAITSILEDAGIPSTSRRITDSSATLQSAREFEPGTSRLSIINDLLASINYRSLWFDSLGRAVAEPYVAPGLSAPIWNYLDDERSVMFEEATKTADLFDVPNEWVLYTSNPDETSLRSVYTNDSPGSITSTVNRGFTITRFEQVEDVADQATLDALAERMAQEASQVYETVELRTGMMPFHEHMDEFIVRHADIKVYDLFQETQWSMTLEAGSTMNHSIRKSVNI